MEEYDFLRSDVKGKLHHLDLWKIDSPEEAGRLKIESLLKPDTVILIEWWQQVANILKFPQDQIIHLTINQPENDSPKRVITVAE